MKNSRDRIVAGSFRDPSGFTFFQEGVLYRQVNKCYQKNYDRLMSSGLYNTLIDNGSIISHEESTVSPPQPGLVYKIIQPESIPFISFPYEWCFSQLKSAALTTLRIQKIALQHGMILKDASAYNIQFRDGKPVLIDTLSFETYREGEAWIAYRQFCQHFLGPLALMAFVDIRLGLMMRNFIDGIPLNLASRLLPIRSRLNVPLLMHIHLHAKSQAKYSDSHLENKAAAKKRAMSGRKVSPVALQALIHSLSSAVKKLRYTPSGTEWSDYYNDTNYSETAMLSKTALIREFLERIAPDSLWDFGSNTGFFSRLASAQGIPTVSFDLDPAAVEKNYLDCLAKREANLLPLVLDLTNPSPSLGWENKERESLMQRGPVQVAMALALIHHLAIANNVPLTKIAHFFHSICRFLIVEFVPKSDSQVQRLLSAREDIFPEYTREGFEQAFEHYFTILDSHHVDDSERSLYLMETPDIQFSGKGTADQ